jgi:hypothetical protein
LKTHKTTTLNEIEGLAKSIRENLVKLDNLFYPNKNTLKKDADAHLSHNLNPTAQVSQVSPNLQAQKQAATPDAIKEPLSPRTSGAPFKLDSNSKPKQYTYPITSESMKIGKYSLHDLIGCQESTCGENTNHAMVTKGVNKDTASRSVYGLMPLTIYELAEKHRPLRNTPLGKRILETKGDWKEINKIVEGNRDIDKELMDHHIAYGTERISKFSNNPEEYPILIGVANKAGYRGTRIMYSKGGLEAVKNHEYYGQLMGRANELNKGGPLKQKLDKLHQDIKDHKEQRETTNANQVAAL